MSPSYKKTLAASLLLAFATGVWAQVQNPVGPAAPKATQIEAPSAATRLPQQVPQALPPAVQPAPPAAVIPPLPAEVSTKPGAGISAEEFGKIFNSQFPITPDQVRQLNKMLDGVERATTERTGPAPLPTTGTTRVSFAAGAGPQVVRVSPGTVSTLVFNDISGSPWMVERVATGQVKVLDVGSGRKDGPSNMVTLNPLVNNVSTNIAVFLEGAPAPIVMAVESGQKSVDFRLDVSVQARGPNAQLPSISRGFVDSVPAELNDMVAGLTPKQAKPLKVVSSDVGDVQAWVMGNRMFVRSRANMLAPAPVRVATGADGTKVYESSHFPQVLMSQGGTPGKVTLSGFPPPALGATNANQ